MNRKKFFRNLLGATAAVTIGKHLPVPKEAVPEIIPEIAPAFVWQQVTTRPKTVMAAWHIVTKYSKEMGFGDDQYMVSNVNEQTREAHLIDMRTGEDRTIHMDDPNYVVIQSAIPEYEPRLKE